MTRATDYLSHVANWIYVQHDCLTCVTRNWIYVRHDCLTCVTRLLCVWHTRVRHWLFESCEAIMPRTSPVRLTICGWLRVALLCVTHTGVVSHMWGNHVAHIFNFVREVTYAHVGSHIYYMWLTTCVSRTQESCHTCEAVMSHVSHVRLTMCGIKWHVRLTIWVMSHVSHLWCEWVTSHMNESRPIWMSHVPYEWVTSHMNESRSIWMSHVLYEWVIRLTTWVMLHVSLLSRKWVTSHMNESRPT